eukprot:287894-Chlamydomonas_euryale.AAC.4
MLGSHACASHAAVSCRATEPQHHAHSAQSSGAVYHITACGRHTPSRNRVVALANTVPLAQHGGPCPHRSSHTAWGRSPTQLPWHSVVALAHTGPRAQRGGARPHSSPGTAWWALVHTVPFTQHTCPMKQLSAERSPPVMSPARTVSQHATYIDERHGPTACHNSMHPTPSSGSQLCGCAGGATHTCPLLRPSCHEPTLPSISCGPNLYLAYHDARTLPSRPDHTLVRETGQVVGLAVVMRKQIRP